MKQKISITAEENDEVERLFLTYNSYMNMLQYLANTDMGNTPVYDKKWKEASDLWIQLDKKKRDIEIKYKPAGDWDSYEFDFDNYQVVFVKNEA